MNEKEALQELYSEDVYNIPGKTLVILPCPWSELNDASVQLLTKILASVKLSLSSVQIISALKIEDIALGVYNPSGILFFGIPSGLDTTPYQLAQFNGIPAIAADALDSFDDAKKKNLWLALKAMFSL